MMAVPKPSSTLVKSHEKLRGGSLETRPWVVRRVEGGLVSYIAGGGQRAALGEGEDAQRGKGEGRGAGKVHSVQPWKMKTWRRDASSRRQQNNI